MDCIQELSNSPEWAEQVENEVFQPTPLSYATAEGGENVSSNQMPNVELNHAPIEAASNNTCSTQGLEPSVIPYIANQPADSQLWDGNFCPISIFRMNEHLEGDARNINCSLHRISAFIRQRKLEDTSAEYIPQIAEFGFVAWVFLSSIYESGWDKLETNKDKKSFSQCVFLQFNRKLSTSFSQKKEDKGKGKPANISKVPLPIHPKPSKSVLAKFKFYKGDQMTRPKSYAQASKGNINEIIKIKDTFLKLSPKKFRKYTRSSIIWIPKFNMTI